MADINPTPGPTPFVVRATISPPDSSGRCRVTEEYASVEDYVARHGAGGRRLPRRRPTHRDTFGAGGPPCDDAFVDQRSGLAPPDLYLRLYRGGAFPARRIGKRIVARWGDVRAALSGTAAIPAMPAREAQNDLDGLRREVGLAVRGRR